MPFRSFDGEKHKEEGVKLYLGRQESFWKSISDSKENHYRCASAYNILTLAIFRFLRIFLHGELENIPRYREKAANESFLSRRERGTLRFKVNLYAPAQMAQGPAISNHAPFVAGCILELVDVQCSAWEDWNQSPRSKIIIIKKKSPLTSPMQKDRQPNSQGRSNPIQSNGNFGPMSKNQLGTPPINSVLKTASSGATKKFSNLLYMNPLKKCSNCRFHLHGLNNRNQGSTAPCCGQINNVWERSFWSWRDGKVQRLHQLRKTYALQHVFFFRRCILWVTFKDWNAMAMLLHEDRLLPGFRKTHSTVDSDFEYNNENCGCTYDCLKKSRFAVFEVVRKDDFRSMQSSEASLEKKKSLGLEGIFKHRNHSNAFKETVFFPVKNILISCASPSGNTTDAVVVTSTQKVAHDIRSKTLVWTLGLNCRVSCEVFLLGVRQDPWNVPMARLDRVRTAQQWPTNTRTHHK